MIERPQLLFTFLSLIYQVLLDTSARFYYLQRGVNVNSPLAKCFTNKHKEGYETGKQLFLLSGFLAQAQCLRQPKAFHEEIPVGFCEEPTSPCHQPSPSSQETGPRQNDCLPPAREILLHSGPGCKLKYVLPVPWLELLRKTSATSKLITERKHPRLKPSLLWERLDAGREIGCRGR